MTTRKLYFIKVLLALTISLVLSLVIMRSSFASKSTSNDQNDPYRIEEFSITAPGELQVQTSGGHITVEGSRSGKVRVEMFVNKNGQTLSADEYDLDEWVINISKSGNSIQAIAKSKNNGGPWTNDHASVSFTVFTPNEMSTNLKTSGGNIEVKGLYGSQGVKTSGGHLTLENLNGSINSQTSGGDIVLTNIEGNIKIKTSGGHIKARNILGTLDARTSGGHIELNDMGGTVRAVTSGGNIAANLTDINQYADLQTSGGNIDIIIPNNIGVDLQLKGTFVGGKLNNFSGKMEDNEIKGTLNEGGPKITARTSGGKIMLALKN